MNLAHLSPRERRAGLAAARAALTPPKHERQHQHHDYDHDHDHSYDTPYTLSPLPSGAGDPAAPKAPDIPAHDQGGGGRGPSLPDTLPESSPPRVPGPLGKVLQTLGRHCAYHIGPGIIASVAYFDPGNWTVDLQAGSTYGYSLLFVVLLSGLGAVLLQVLACRMGVVTGLDLAQHCRKLLYPRALTRWCVLYPLYALAESAIVFTDLAELLGSAIALNLIFPTLPLYAGVLITSTDVLIILALWRPGPAGSISRAGRLFEAGIVLLCLAVLGCFVVLLVRVGPEWGEAFKGYLPNGAIFQPNGLYISIGILGATVMPHAIFLGSALATQARSPGYDRAMGPALPAQGVPGLSLSSTDPTTLGEPEEPSPKRSLPLPLPSLPARLKSLLLWDSQPPPPRQTGNNGSRFVSAHMGHAVADIVCSLLLLALVINSAILILGGTAYYYQTGPTASADIFSAHALLSAKLGPPAAFLFAFALLCSGQSASVTATMAGQIVSEGFLEWRVSPFVRRLLTRCIGLVPSTIVALTAGRAGIDTLLVASQVALSICLPGVIFPLLWITSGRKGRMEVVSDEPEPLHPAPKVPFSPPPPSPSPSPVSRACPASTTTTTTTTAAAAAAAGETESQRSAVKVTNYGNHWTGNVLGWLLFLVICAANAYVIVELAMGNSG
ncbi:natural resistance-associated macrophage protein [Calocera cornea HHB12733]|uniref:Natural resistance-associated macrophage protein n=1 Tax=Calocera cornea HHB12733 TaxID=1353952 RepID=A0A165J1V3_9BASI|nr:natural resistance-associated macrophage protein [Calocera cornea HHB12733]